MEYTKENYIRDKFLTLSESTRLSSMYSHIKSNDKDIIKLYSLKDKRYKLCIKTKDEIKYFYYNRIETAKAIYIMCYEYILNGNGEYIKEMALLCAAMELEGK